jgi:hypothetical protein
VSILIRIFGPVDFMSILDTMRARCLIDLYGVDSDEKNKFIVLAEYMDFVELDSKSDSDTK